MWNPAVASSTAGYLSIACWLVVFTPQLWENYRRQSGDGLSLTFLVIWLAGDIFNLVGVILQDLLPTMFLLALWYTVADMGLIWQVLYYYRRSETMGDEVVFVSESAPLLGPDRRGPAFKNNDEHHTSKHHGLTNAVAGFSIFLVTAVSCYMYYSIHSNADYDGDAKEFALLPQLFGWTSAVLYVGSRIPQIVKNWRNKSTEGLSFGMFVCAVLGNILFTSSIFFRSTDPQYVLLNLSWIIGSCGTLVFDFIIFLQFFIYDPPKSSQ
ncbi:PQ loop repeat-domain-containing protein [Radiomyces spectabilis]|uniref:PQ loop repeat-domain-containing protein n=1 Tax=Radiomyces spectabilis TaxID=64574 RepID=UPI00221F57D3|nr:PQ loop repeat-domain-containing protein [Radiomyces spectabilis]KAI8377408.1 PQ loop repeat-domain-containing protein [Radiomyces spectabilis]